MSSGLRNCFRRASGRRGSHRRTTRAGSRRCPPPRPRRTPRSGSGRGPRRWRRRVRRYSRTCRRLPRSPCPGGPITAVTESDFVWSAAEVVLPVPHQRPGDGVETEGAVRRSRRSRDRRPPRRWTGCSAWGCCSSAAKLFAQTMRPGGQVGGIDVTALLGDVDHAVVEAVHPGRVMDAPEPTSPSSHRRMRAGS